MAEVATKVFFFLANHLRHFFLSSSHLDRALERSPASPKYRTWRTLGQNTILTMASFQIRTKRRIPWCSSVRFLNRSGPGDGDDRRSKEGVSRRQRRRQPSVFAHAPFFLTSSSTILITGTLATAGVLVAGLVAFRQAGFDEVEEKKKKE